jgi:DNA polymerase III subunit epsilon
MRPPIIGKTADGSKVVLNRFDGKFAAPVRAEATRPEDLRTGAVVDCETTGLDARTDRIIEVAVRLFRYDRRTSEIVAAGEQYAAFEDPGTPIPANIVELTGITDEQVRGKHVDKAKVRAMLGPAHLIVAHNARFDRPRLEAFLGSDASSAERVWACSATDVDWTGSKGFPSGKLEILSLYHGFFVDAHRAAADVDALLHLLMQRDHKTGIPYFRELRVNANKKQVRVEATGSPIESKDLLRERRYRWKADRRVWEKTIREDDVELEHRWLADHVYLGESRATITPVPQMQRFLDED